MQVHKFMYFIQRESLIESEELLVDESIYGWKFGPILKSVRSEYNKVGNTPSNVFCDTDNNISDNTKKLIHSVLNRYGNLSPWHLSALSHNEFSWILSRKALKIGQNGDAKLNVSAMKCDALREKARRCK